MKQFLTLLAVAVTTSGMAQNLAATEYNIVREGVLTGYDHIMDVKIYNLTPNSLQLNWNRSVNDMPGTWVSAICDCSLCHDTATSYAVFTDPMDAGDSCFISCHIRDNGSTHGVGTVTVEFYDPNDSATTNMAITWQYSAWPLGVNDATGNEVRVYPNPAASLIMVDHGHQAAEIRLLSVDGRLLKTISTGTAAATMIALGDVSTGTLIVEVLSKTGQVMTSATVVRF